MSEHEHITEDEGAVRIVAARVLCNLAEDVKDQWENYPEIGAFDWDRVAWRVYQLARVEGNPSDLTYDEAYAILESRAENDA